MPRVHSKEWSHRTCGGGPTSPPSPPYFNLEYLARSWVEDHQFPCSSVGSTGNTCLRAYSSIFIRRTRSFLRFSWPFLSPRFVQVMYFLCSRIVPEVVDIDHLAGMQSLLAAQPSRPPTEIAPSQTLKPGSGWKINLFHKCFYRFNPPCPLMLDEVEDARNAILVAHIVLLYTFVALKWG